MNKKMLKFIKKLPNIITIMRFVMVPVFMYVFFSYETYWSLIIFLIISFGDVLDGYIARKFDAVSDFGKLMDPLADKLISVSAIVCLCIIGYLPMFVLIIIAIKEILMIFGGILLYNHKVTVFSNWVGKITSLFTNIAVASCFLHKNFAPLDWYLLYFAIGLQIFAFVQYAYINVLIPYKKGTLFDKQ